MQAERALRFLDTLDSLAYAARTACAGYWGRRLGFMVASAGLLSAVMRLAGVLA